MMGSYACAHVTSVTVWVVSKNESNTPIANMATISPKRGFSVVTVAKGWPALFFQKFCSLYTEKYWMLKSTGRPVFGQISSKYSKIHLRGVVKVSFFIKATFSFSLLCRFGRR